MKNQCQNLTKMQRNKLLKLLQKIEDLFDVTLGAQKIYLVDFKLKQDKKPICSIPYPVPKVHEEIFKKEVERLVLLGFLKIANDSEQGSPSFSQPKPKTNQLRFLSYFISLNKQLKCKPYPMPNINEMLLKLEGFQYVASLDLNMVYYHIQLRDNESNLCTIILHWGDIVTNVYQWDLITDQTFYNRKLMTYFIDLILSVRTYIDELLVLTKR